MFWIGSVVTFLGMLLLAANDDVKSTSLGFTAYMIMIVGAALMASAIN